MEWLVDDFLVDPTSSLLQKTPVHDDRKSTPYKGPPPSILPPPSATTEEDEEELLCDDTQIISIAASSAKNHAIQPKKPAAPGRLKQQRQHNASTSTSPTRTAHEPQTSLNNTTTSSWNSVLTPGRVRRITRPRSDCHDEPSDQSEENASNKSHDVLQMAPQSAPGRLLQSDLVPNDPLDESPGQIYLTQQNSPSSGSSVDRLLNNNRLTTYLAPERQFAAASQARSVQEIDNSPRELRTRGGDPPAAALIISTSLSSDDEKVQQDSSNLDVRQQSTTASPGSLPLHCEPEGLSAPAALVMYEDERHIQNRRSDQPSVERKLTVPDAAANRDCVADGEVTVTSSNHSGLVGKDASFSANLAVVNVPSDRNVMVSLSDDQADQVASHYIHQMLSSPPPDSLSPTNNVGNGSKEEQTDPVMLTKVSSATTLSTKMPTSLPKVDSSAMLEESDTFEQDNILGMSVPRQVQIRSEFEPGEVYASWKPSARPFESQMNQRGVFHVRILRAQRLACPVGSKVEAIVSLLPWKGKVRTDTAEAFSNETSKCGVCARWNEDGSPTCVTHSYSSEESPVPSLQVDIVFSPLGVFDVTLCSITTACHNLMSAPLVHQRQWFSATKADGETAAMVEIEAMFQPAADDERDGSDVSVLDDLPGSAAKASLLANFNADNNSESDVSMSLQSTMRTESRATTEPHLFRILSHWKPAVCCVCKRNITSGLRGRKSYRCEVCSMDCCTDCQLQVDVKLPCGSDAADLARDQAIQNRLTIGNILNTVAPVDVSNSSLLSASIHSRRSTLAYRQDTGTIPDEVVANDGIGKIKFLFVRACMLKQPLAPLADDFDLFDDPSVGLREGDYYIRVVSNGILQTKRTHTVQSSSRPRFMGNEISFGVAHYGSEFLIELIDAMTDKAVGKTLITAQTLLQLQRDAIAEQSIYSYLSLICGQRSDQTVRLKLPLRGGLNKGFGYEFFVDGKSKISASEQLQPGSITGAVELQANLKEDMSALFGRDPYACPARPPGALDLAVLQIHIGRISDFVRDVYRMIDGYKYMTSWKNPFVTGLSLLVFLQLWSWSDSAHAGCMPCAFTFVTMVYLAFARKYGRLKERALSRSLGRVPPEESTVDYTLYRPAGLLRVSVSEGRNLRSELGLPGKVGCSVFWDPIRFEDSKKSSKSKAENIRHDIATTLYHFDTKPKWGSLAESSLSKRLKLVLPDESNDEFFHYDSEEESASFPVLQPYRRIDDDLLVLESWESSPAAVVFEVRFIDTVSLLPGSVYTLGEVVVPFSHLVQHKEISGWFDIVDSSLYPSKSNKNTLQHLDNKGEVAPQVFLTVRWNAPSKDPSTASENEREASFVIEEELLRSLLTDKTDKAGLVGTSVGAFNTVIGISDQLALVQNTLGSVLDAVGAMRSLFNFADPFKSGILLCATSIAWLFLALVPTRLIVLAAGLAQYVLTFYARFAHLLISNKHSTREKTGDRETSPYATWIRNAFLGLPTDEDIRKTYFWESRRKQEEYLEKRANKKRTARLKRLWRAQWYSQVLIIDHDDDGRVIKTKAFAMVQGHRLLWWPAAEDFDKGEPYSGQILLAGHAGLTTPSPIELRALDQKDFTVNRVVCIFGHQEKITIVAPSEEMKERLEQAVQSAAASKQD